MRKKLIPLKKFAEERAGCSFRHIRRMGAKGKGPPTIMIGDRRSIMVDEDDGEAWLASRKRFPPGWKAASDENASAPALDKETAEAPFDETCDVASEAAPSARRKIVKEPERSRPPPAFATKKRLVVAVRAPSRKSKDLVGS